MQFPHTGQTHSYKDFVPNPVICPASRVSLRLCDTDDAVEGSDPPTIRLPLDFELGFLATASVIPRAEFDFGSRELERHPVMIDFNYHFTFTSLCSGVYDV